MPVLDKLLIGIILTKYESEHVKVENISLFDGRNQNSSES